MCLFYVFLCYTYFRYFWVKKHCFLPQIMSTLFLHNRLEFSFQILNIGQWGYVVVLFSRFIHFTHILGTFWVKNILFRPKSFPRYCSITAWSFILNFKHRSVGIFSCAFCTFHSCQVYLYLGVGINVFFSRHFSKVYTI